MKNDSLELVLADLTEWRAAHPTGGRIPEKLWLRAANLVATEGITKVAKILRLSFSRLKRRVSPKPLGDLKKPKFVSLKQAPGGELNCVFKLESATGGRLQAEVQGLRADGLSHLLRDFARN